VDPVYRMSYNESPLGPAPSVIAAIRQAAPELGLYPPMGDESLRQALAHTLGRGLSEAHFFTGCSGYEALEFVARAFLRPGQEMIISPPTFEVYRRLAQLQGAEVVEVPLHRPNYEPDIAAILAAITERTRLLLLCNPNNPTGTIMTAEAMAWLVRELPDHVLLVTDEVYHHFVTRSDFPDSLGYVLAGKPVIVIHTFSKAYGLAGLRLGYAVASPEIADEVGGLQRAFHQSRLALAAGLAALQDQAHLRANVQAVVEGRAWLVEQFERLDLPYLPSQTNFIMVQTPGPAQAIAEALLDWGVIVRAMPGELDHWLRVSVSRPEGNRRFIEGLTAQLKG
jgi:histidinol-phosphate aminotransferase